MFVIKYKNFFLALTTVLTILSIVAIIVFGMRLSIDFTGGSLTEVVFQDSRLGTDMAAVKNRLEQAGFAGATVQPIGNDKGVGYLIRTRSLNQEDHEALLSALGGEEGLAVTEERFASVGPTIGRELQKKAIIACIIVMVVTIAFVAFAFRKVSKPVASWKYGLVAIATLVHDILVPLGVFVVLGRFMGVEIDILFVTAILGTLGYSVYDTIVVFDRIRENLAREADKRNPADFEDIVGASVSQTYARSINTSITSFLTLLALFIFGSSATTYFSLALLLGVIVGTYSSIILASPLLVLAYKLQKE
jgi:preprotein translocase subunit SecF